MGIVWRDKWKADVTLICSIPATNYFIWSTTNIDNKRAHSKYPVLHKEVLFNCDELLRILILSFFIETKSWQKHQFLSDSNKLANFNKCKQRIPPKKILPQKILPKNPPKKSSPKKSPQKNPPRKILPKNSSEKNSEKYPKNTPLKSWKNPKYFQNFSKSS